MKISRMTAQIRAGIRRTVKFVAEDVWDIELTSLSALRASGVKAVRVICLVFHGFRKDECPLHASALTFSTLMAVVPVLAISLSLARGFGGDEAAKDWIRDRVNDWTQTFRLRDQDASDLSRGASVSNGVVRVDAAFGEDLAISGSDIADQINTLVEKGFEKVENISFAKLGSVGLILLLWMVVQVLGRVESSFNRVWGIMVGRSVWRRFTDYLSVLLILPLLVVAAASLPALDLATRFLDERTASVIRGFVGSGLYKGLTVATMTALAFAFLLMFMPNTRVHFRPALVGGVTAALLFLFWLWICAAIQSGVGKYGKIYGSFAIVPILLAWVYVSWQIVLFGAEVAFATQNCNTFRMEQGARNASIQARLGLALTVLSEAAEAMLARNGGFTLSAFVNRHHISVRFLNDVIDELVQAGYLGRLADEEPTYVLLRAPADVLVRDVVSTVMTAGVPGAELGLSLPSSKIRATVVGATEGVNRALRETTLAELVASSEAG